MYIYISLTYYTYILKIVCQVCRGRLPICLSIVFPKLVQPREVIERLKRDNWLLCLFDRKIPVPACSAKLSSLGRE